MAEPKLLDRMRALLRTRHYSIRTEDTYVQWARRFILFQGKRHPSMMGAPEINELLSSLAAECLGVNAESGVECDSLSVSRGPR